MRGVALIGLAAALSLTAGDWLNVGGDAEHRGWQRRGKSIGVSNAGEIKLLWKLKLEGTLTAPVMLGPIITHRGIKELVFVGAGSGTVYAVDADLGRVFWKRRIEGAVGGGTCGQMGAPAIAPAPGAARVGEDDDEGHTPMRPFYFVASDGVLHTIRPSDGVDMAPARSFVPVNAGLSALTFADGFVYGAPLKGCGAEGVWKIEAADAKAKASFVAATGSGTAVHGRATWSDPQGARWSYAAVDGKVAAFRIEETGGVALVPDWVSGELGKCGAPVIANGVVYAVGNSGHAVLYALDARTGKQLYASGNAIGSVARVSELGVANGHVCFGADDGLYCFGLPIEI